MAKKNGLGKGIDALFLDNEEDINKTTSTLRLSEIEPDKNQPRTIFNHEPLEELAASIAANGLIQPIVVRPSQNGFYKIIAGERRWRASKMAGLTEVPVVILDADDRKAAQLSLIENLHRENLNALEEAAAYKALIENHDLTQEELSSKLGKSRSAIANSMRLLDLPDQVSDMVKKNELSAGHARALLGLTNKADIVPLATKIINKGLSVRMTEDAVRLANKKKKEEKKESSGEIKIDYTRELEKRISEKLGRQAHIIERGKKKRFVLEYTDGDDLEKIIKKLCGATFFDD